MKNILNRRIIVAPLLTLLFCSITWAADPEETTPAESEPTRDTASAHRRHGGGNGGGGIPVKLGADGGFGTNSLGIAFGGHLTVGIPVVPSPHRIEIMGSFLFFPSAGNIGFGTSNRVMHFGGFARYGYHVAPGIYIGPEAGAIMGITKLGSSGLGATSTSTTAMSVALGAYAEAHLGGSWSALVGTRLLLKGSSLLFSGGLQYHF